MKKLLFLFFLLFGVVMAWVQEKAPKTKHPSGNKFSDELIRKIYILKDKRDGVGLKDYLDHQDPLVRKNAALAFASLQDTAALPALTRLLQDESHEVKIAAAFALGQLYDSGAELPLINALEVEQVPLVRKTLLEALGKCVTQENVSYLVMQEGKDALEREGMAWGMYRAGIRNVHDDSTTQVIMYLLDTINTYETRLGAAHYLARSEQLSLKMYQDQVIASAQDDPSPFVRMAATLALKHLKDDKTLLAIRQRLLNDPDYRVRINAIQVLARYPFDKVKDLLFMTLHDEYINVAIAAAETIAARATGQQTAHIDQALQNVQNGRIRGLLMGTCLKLATPAEKESWSAKLLEAYRTTDRIYEKAALLRALSYDIDNYAAIKEATFQAKHPILSTAGTTALIDMSKQEGLPGALHTSLVTTFQSLIEKGDLTQIGLVAEVLADADLNFKKEYQNFDFLYRAKDRLKLPRDNEAMQSLQRAIDLFEDSAVPTVIKNNYNHPVDWALAQTIARGTQAEINTSKGKILIELLIEEAPGSVVNFVELVRQDYFKDKNFHRVVPNFVVQGGCNRGDGWGSEDYSIRSEFGQVRYGEGYVGMASAGKDTEGTQWFITHSPTPHLDGRYTIFAKVIDGMETVHQIEVGDRIQTVKLIESKTQDVKSISAKF